MKKFILVVIISISMLAVSVTGCGTGRENSATSISNIRSSIISSSVEQSIVGTSDISSETSIDESSSEDSSNEISANSSSSQENFSSESISSENSSSNLESSSSQEISSSEETVSSENSSSQTSSSESSASESSSSSISSSSSSMSSFSSSSSSSEINSSTSSENISSSISSGSSSFSSNSSSSNSSSSIVQQYTITWLNWDGSVLAEQTLEEGEIPSYTSTPTRPATAQYTYTFSGWDKEIVAVSGNEVYTAMFSSELNKYTVTVTRANEYGTLYLNNQASWTKTITNVPYGTAINLSGQTINVNGSNIKATPWAEYQEEGYHCEFEYWVNASDEQITSAMVDGDITIKALFSLNKNKYNIVWWDSEGLKELDTDNLEYGSTLVYDGEKPTKQATAEYTYTFVGWSLTKNGSVIDLKNEKVDSDKNYFAIFTAVKNTYTITWQNEDGTLLETDENVLYGATPEYNGATPTKNADKQYSYTFEEWSPSVSSVTGNVTYTATFSSELNKYTVTVTRANEYGTLYLNNQASWTKTITNVPYGTAINLSGQTINVNGSNIKATPWAEYHEEGYHCEFEYWVNASDEKITNATVDGDITIKALFSLKISSYNVYWKDSEGVEILETDYIVYGTRLEYNGDTPVKQTTVEYSYTFAGWSLTENGSIVDTSTLIITKDTTLYAIFTPIELFVSYAKFGAVGNGITDDFNAIFKAHLEANNMIKNGAYTFVKAEKGATYKIKSTVVTQELYDYVTSNYALPNGYADASAYMKGEYNIMLSDRSNLNFAVGVATTIPIITNVDWSGANFIIDDTHIIPYEATVDSSGAVTRFNLNSGKLVTNSNKEYSTDIFTVVATASEKKEGIGINSNDTVNKNIADFKSLVNSLSGDKTILKELNNQIFNEGLGPNTTKLNISLGRPAMLYIYNEWLSTTADRYIAGETVSVGDQRVLKRYSSGTMSGGTQKQELVIVDEYGNIDLSTRLTFDYTRIYLIDIYYLDVNEINISGGNFNHLSNRFDCGFSLNSDGTYNATATSNYDHNVYFARGLNVNRSNVKVNGVVHNIENEISLYEYHIEYKEGPAYNGFFYALRANDVTFENCVIPARKYYLQGTYGLGATAVNDLKFVNCSQSNFWITVDGNYNLTNAEKDSAGAVLGMKEYTYPSGRGQKQYLWGVGGTNRCKNMEYHNSTLSRFDAHLGLYNGKIINSTVSGITVVGGGDLYLENVTVYANSTRYEKNSIVELRTDYGATWNGTFYFDNVTLNGAKNSPVGALVYFRYTSESFGQKCYLPNIVAKNITFNNVTSKSIFASTYGSEDKLQYMNLDTLGDGVTLNQNVVTMPTYVKVDDYSYYTNLFIFNGNNSYSDDVLLKPFKNISIQTIDN